MSIYLQYASDLHLEFPANKEYLKQHLLQPVGDVLVLAGDIVPFAVMDKHRDFFNYVSDHFKYTYWVPGNHEYYRFDITKKCGVINEHIRSNVFLVNNTTVLIDQIQLIFSTLWTRISPANQWAIERGLNDFHQIRYNSHRFSAEYYNQLHEESLSFMKKAIEEAKKATTEATAKATETKAATASFSSAAPATVAVTHHVPTFLNYPPAYKGDVLNEAFAVELFDFIESSGVDYWVYGHHHFNTPEYTIGATKLITNQLGYVQRSEHLKFEPNKTNWL